MLSDQGELFGKLGVLFSELGALFGELRIQFGEFDQRSIFKLYCRSTRYSADEPMIQLNCGIAIQFVNGALIKLIQKSHDRIDQLSF